MLLSALSVLVVAQSSSEIPEGLMNNPVYPTRCTVTQFMYFWKVLYMFRVVSPPIIRSTHNCIYSIWYLSNRNCYLPLSWKSWNVTSQLFVSWPLVTVGHIFMETANAYDIIRGHYSVS